MPTVSVILPTFNRTELLRCSIDSVFAQTFKDWEMIIGDDGSGEATQSYLRSLKDPRVRTLWLAHSGNPALVRNAALKVARGRYVAFLDSDDLWAASKLERQLGALGDRPERLWSYTHCDEIDQGGQRFGAPPTGEPALPEGWIVDAIFRLEVPITMPSIVAERSLVDEIGGFDEQLLFGEYYDLCVRLALRSQVVAIAEPLCSVRHHEENYSVDRVGDYAGWVRLYGKMMELAPCAELRRHCLSMRAKTSVILAGLRGDRGDYGGVWATLASASIYSWRYPGWWRGAVKAVTRPLVPKPLLSAYRRRFRGIV